MDRKLVLVLVFLFATVFGVGFTRNASAAPADNPNCDKFSGAAYGMCLAAYAIGCDDPATANPGCATIEEKFTQVTGQPPVWTLPKCPCGTAASFIDYLGRGSGPQRCAVETGYRLIVKSIYNQVHSTYPGYSRGDFCGNSEMNFAITELEAASCINELETIISQYGMVCDIY